MKIFIWRHSKKFSSWSMFDEPHVYKDNYMKAEVAVLAGSEQEALELLRSEPDWDIEELKRIRPEVLALDCPMVISRSVSFG